MAGFVTKKNIRAGAYSQDVAASVVPTTTITILDEEGEDVGYIQDLNPSQDRPVEPVRHLNSTDAGRIVEGVPRPANFTVSATGFVLYRKGTDTGSTISRMIKGTTNPNKLMKSLEEQKIPFILKEVISYPAGGDAEDDTTVYHGCWITRWNKSTSINNAFVTDTVDLFVSFVDDDANEE